MSGLVPIRKKNEALSTDFFDFDHMLDDFFADVWGWPLKRSLLASTFKVDVQDRSSEYVVEAELPGVEKNEIGISLDGEVLKIQVEKRESSDTSQKNYIHKERRYSSMARSITLPNITAEGVTAKLENGILVITVPKKVKEDTSVSIEIQ